MAKLILLQPINIRLYMYIFYYRILKCQRPKYIHIFHILFTKKKYLEDASYASLIRTAKSENIFAAINLHIFPLRLNLAALLRNQICRYFYKEKLL